MRHALLTFFASVCLFTTALAQEVGVGQWRDHLPYRNVHTVAEGDEFVWAATDHSLFSFHKTDNSLERMSKVWGMSDVGVSSMRYHEPTQTLIVGYANGNIDLLKDESVYNLAAIKISSVLGSKAVNNISIIDELAYLATGFGIVVVDVARREVKDTYYIGTNGSSVNVQDVASDGTYLYAATTNGLYRALASAPNLSNFEVWSKQTDIPKPDAHYHIVRHFNDRLLLAEFSNAFQLDTLFQRTNDSWEVVTELLGDNINSIEPRGNNLLIALGGQVSEFDSNWQETLRIFDYNTGLPPSPQFALAGSDNIIWIGDRGNGMIKSINEFEHQQLQPAGPFSNNAVTLAVWQQTLIVGAGGLNGSLANLFSQEGASYLIDGEWSWVNASNSAEYRTNDVRDIMCVAVDPFDQQHTFLGSYGWGVVELRNGAFQNLYNPANTPLDTSVVDGSKVQISDLAFDVEGNMWVGNSGAAEALAVRTFAGDWYSYDVSDVYSPVATEELIINADNYKWLAMPKGGGILVYDDNRTPGNPNDDRKTVLNSQRGSGNLPSTAVTALAEGLDGEIWIGSDKGIAVMYTPSNVFTNNDYDAQQITVTVGGYTGYLLEAEKVTAIAVDGQNRKWVGTDGAGVFLLSADGTDQLLHFTAEDSPLLSNSILDIVIDHLTGEVYFATNDGLISYKGTATAGNLSYETIYAYPNPVEPGFAGTIAIKGLKRDTDVKITDINGQLVYQTLSNGGQAVWDGNNLFGEPVATGVYLVFCAELNGRDEAVTKILVVR